MKRIIISAIFSIMLVGCNHNPVKPDDPIGKTVSVDQIEPSKLANSLPQFVMESNEVMISDSFSDVDPTLVIGAIIDLKSKTVHALDSYLKADAKVATLALKETAFHNLVEDSLVANADWLSFVKADVNTNCKAEVSVIKSAKVTVPISSIDIPNLKKKLDGIPNEKRSDYGIVIGYVDYLLSASFFRNNGAGVKASGYGANIGGTWYSKAENTAAHHRLVALWSPLPFVAEKASSTPKGKNFNLEQATKDAIKSGTITIQPLNNLRFKSE